MNTFRCASCEKETSSLLKSNIIYHSFDGDLHIVMSKNPDVPQDHVAIICFGCSFNLLEGMLHMEQVAHRDVVNQLIQGLADKI